LDITHLQLALVIAQYVNQESTQTRLLHNNVPTVLSAFTVQVLLLQLALDVTQVRIIVFLVRQRASHA
jgi:hypothetical protein